MDDMSCVSKCVKICASTDFFVFFVFCVEKWHTQYTYNTHRYPLVTVKNQFDCHFRMFLVPVILVKIDDDLLRLDPIHRDPHDQNQIEYVVQEHHW